MTFETNLSESFAKIGATAITSDPARGGSGGIDVFRLPTGAVIAWRCPDDTGMQETQVGAALARIAAEGAQRIHGVDGDDTRTGAWKAEQRAKIAAETQERFGAARQEADKIITAFAEADAVEAAPPPLAATDHAGALVDHECRTWLRTLDRDATLALVKELGDPKYARLLTAIMRSPVPFPAWIAEPARAAWIEAGMKADPHGNRLRRAAAARADWLRSITAQVGGVIEAMQPKSTKPVITRAA